jgi:hypothetical protein
VNRPEVGGEYSPAKSLICVWRKEISDIFQKILEFVKFVRHVTINFDWFVMKCQGIAAHECLDRSEK